MSSDLDFESAISLIQTQQHDFFTDMEKISEKADPSLLSHNKKLLSTSRQRGAFPVKALIVSVIPTKKKSITGTGNVDSYLVILRLFPGSVSIEDIRTYSIDIKNDEFGNASYYVPTVCDLSKKKLDLYKQKIQIQLGEEAAASSSTNASGNTSSSSHKDDNAIIDQSKQGTKRKDHPSSNGNVGQNGTKQQTNQPSKYRKAIVNDTTKAIPNGPVISDVTDHDEEHDEEQNHNSNSNSNSSSSSSMAVSVYDGSHADHLSDHTDNLKDDDMVMDDDDSSNVYQMYEADEIEGRPYLGHSIKINMCLPISKEVMFGVDESALGSGFIPKEWTIVSVDIKGNPYIDEKNCYKTKSWTICSFGDTENIPSTIMYKFMEMIGQTTPIVNMMSRYLKKANGGGFKDEDEKTAYRFNKDSSTWFVVGNDLTHMNPLSSVDPGNHVLMNLERITDLSKFIKPNPKVNKAFIGIIPYRFWCTQWKGAYSIDNPTLMKFYLEVDVKWQHICPEVLGQANKGGPSLGITSLQAWLCFIPSIYPHIKVALLAIEDSFRNSTNNLNLDRYGAGISKNNFNLINTPHSDSVSRCSTSVFKTHMIVNRSILLPLHSLKSCLIRVTQDYILSPHVWGSAPRDQRRPPTFAENVTHREHDKNDLIHCLSEMKDPRSFFTTDDSSSKNKGRTQQASYNFYALLNVCYKSSISKMFNHARLTPQEGVVYVEAIRNILSSGVSKGFLKPKSVDSNNIAGNNMFEKYKNFLLEKKIPEKSILYKIDVGDIQITGQEGNSLMVYFYAIPIDVDDPEDKKFSTIFELKEPLAPETMSLFIGGNSVGDKKNAKDENDNTKNVDEGYNNDNRKAITEDSNGKNKNEQVPSQKNDNDDKRADKTAETPKPKKQHEKETKSTKGKSKSMKKKKYEKTPHPTKKSSTSNNQIKNYLDDDDDEVNVQNEKNDEDDGEDQDSGLNKTKESISDDDNDNTPKDRDVKNIPNTQGDAMNDSEEEAVLIDSSFDGRRLRNDDDEDEDYGSVKDQDDDS